MNAKFKEILEKIRPEIFDDLECDLVEDGVIDSLDIMTIITECENVFEIDFDPDDVSPENFASIDAMWALIEKYQAEKGE
jgi:acyl carrier protein